MSPLYLPNLNQPGSVVLKQIKERKMNTLQWFDGIEEMPLFRETDFYSCFIRFSLAIFGTYFVHFKGVCNLCFSICSIWHSRKIFKRHLATWLRLFSHNQRENICVKKQPYFFAHTHLLTSRAAAINGKVVDFLSNLFATLRENETEITIELGVNRLPKSLGMRMYVDWFRRNF